MKEGVSKGRGIKRRVDRGSCSLCSGIECAEIYFVYFFWKNKVKIKPGVNGIVVSWNVC